MRNHSFAVFLVVSGLLSGFSSSADAAGPSAHDPVVLSFATVGDSRQDSTNFDLTAADAHSGRLTGQDAHWLQNSRALARILRGVGNQRAQLLFFNGDMIMGYGRAGVPAGWASSPPTIEQVAHADLVQTLAQYAFWRGMMAPLMEAGTYVVPVPGNHESQCNAAHQTDPYNQLPCPKGKHAVAENEAAWSEGMGDLILDEARFEVMFGERPTHFSAASPARDGEITDQSKLTYSFDFRGSHFAVINTDPVGVSPAGAPLDSHAPTKWLAADLEAAARRGMRHLFVFGHKMAYTYDFLGTGEIKARGLDEDVDARDRFWALIEQFHATYFCGHEHVYVVMRPQGGSYQVMVGSGGSPFDVPMDARSVQPATDRTYAWATVRVHRSGKVVLETWGFSDRFGPTRRLARYELTR